jgi:hypothetical protein
MIHEAWCRNKAIGDKSKTTDYRISFPKKIRMNMEYQRHESIREIGNDKRTTGML